MYMYYICMYVINVVNYLRLYQVQIQFPFPSHSHYHIRHNQIREIFQRKQSKRSYEVKGQMRSKVKGHMRSKVK